MSGQIILFKSDNWIGRSIHVVPNYRYVFSIDNRLRYRGYFKKEYIMRRIIISLVSSLLALGCLSTAAYLSINQIGDGWGAFGFGFVGLFILLSIINNKE